MKKLGIHTPELTTYFHQQITTDTGMCLDDTSYSNDACDSLGVGEYFQLYLPNAGFMSEDQDLFNTFAVELRMPGKEIQLSFENYAEFLDWVLNGGGYKCFRTAVDLLKKETKQILREEKIHVFNNHIKSILNDVVDNGDIDTHQMLKRIIDVSENLIITDF